MKLLEKPVDPQFLATGSNETVDFFILDFTKRINAIIRYGLISGLLELLTHNQASMSCTDIFQGRIPILVN